MQPLNILAEIKTDWPKVGAKQLQPRIGSPMATQAHSHRASLLRRRRSLSTGTAMSPTPAIMQHGNHDALPAANDLLRSHGPPDNKFPDGYTPSCVVKPRRTMILQLRGRQKSSCLLGDLLAVCSLLRRLSYHPDSHKK